MFAERLACVHVRKMHLDEGDMRGSHGVAQGHAGVGESGGVEQDEGDLVFHRLLYPPDQLVFSVALTEAGTVPRGLGLCGEPLIDGLERDVAVMLRLACAQQVQIRAVQYENFGHGSLYFDNWPEAGQGRTSVNCGYFPCSGIDLSLSSPFVTLCMPKPYLSSMNMKKQDCRNSAKIAAR